MASVQFFGLDNVITAAHNLGTPAWAIYISPTLRFTKYEGDSMDESLRMLQTNLEALQDNNTAGTYTIKFYELADGAKGRLKIGTKSATESCGFNFKLMTAEERTQNVIGGQFQYGALAGIVKENQDLKKRLDLLEQREDPEPETDAIGSLITDLIRQPEKLGALINIGKSLLSGKEIQPAMIGTLVTPAVKMDTTMDDHADGLDYNRIGAAVDTLAEKVPDLAANLEKLAAMDADKLNTLLKMMP